jgi:D-alanyl-D-alanine carboxypeptidase/D-alanyl-D-alanine-endopeptidase (penicillin-binding protein 4)
LNGTIPNSRGTFTIKGAQAQPSVIMGEYLRKYLPFAAGSGEVMPLEHYPDDTVFLGAAKGKSVAEISEICNLKSINLFAEGLMMHAGKQHGCNDYSCALSVWQEWWKKQMGLRPIFVGDACGLSRANAVMPAQIGDLLYFLYQNPKFKPFVKGLPQSGVSGTLANFGANSALKGKLRAKTGSMERVRNIAGYLEVENKSYIVVVFCENFACNTSQVKMLQEKLLNSILNP